MDNIEKFFGLFAKSKIPSLTLLGIIFYSGVKLTLSSAGVIVSPAGIGGAIILVVGCVLSLIGFLDYRYKEHSDSAFDHLSKANNALAKTIKITSDTTIAQEKSKQGTYKSENNVIGKEGKRQYRTAAGPETSTE